MSENSLFNKVDQAAGYLSAFRGSANTAVILGTGMSSVLDDSVVLSRVSYRDIPFFPLPSVVSHGAEILLLDVAGKKIIALTGRLHYYEGYSMEEVTFGIRVLKRLGIQNLIMTNITGAVNSDIQVGDIVVVKDHINLQSANPLRGVKDERLGARFPDMLKAYNPQLIKLAFQIAEQLKIQIRHGVYTAVDGPSLETPAEYEMIRRLGGDIIGMSTVPEVIVARQCEMKTLVLSIASNVHHENEITTGHAIDEIIANVQIGTPQMKVLVRGILAKI